MPGRALLRLDALPLPALLLDAADRVLAANAAARNLLGRAPLGDDARALLRDATGAAIAPSDADGRAATLTTADGTLRRCTVYVGPANDGDGEAAAERVVALVPIAQAGGSGLGVDLLADAVDAADNCIVVADALADDFPLVFVNDGFVELTGYAREDAIGRNCRFLQRRADGSVDDATPMQERALEAIRRGLREGTAVEGVILRNYRRDGSRFFNELFITPIRDADGRVTHVVGVQNDVTARVEAEERLRVRVESLRSVFDAMPVPLGLLERDSAGDIAHVFGNTAATDAFGLTDGTDSFDGLGFTDAARRTWADAMARAAALHAPVRFEAPRTDARTFEVTVSAVDPEAAPEAATDLAPRFFYLATDVTEGRALADDLVEVSARQLERVAQDIHDGVGQTLVGASLAASALAESLAADGGRAAREATRLRAMVGQALGQLRQFALGLDPLDLDRIGLAGALARVASDARAVLGVEVSAQAAGAEGVSSERAADLVRIAQEALTNAVRHGRAARVEIAAERTPDGALALTVADDGAGLPPNVEAKAEGVGLRSMRIRARRLGGTFEIGPRDGGGTRVRVVVPL